MQKRARQGRYRVVSGHVSDRSAAEHKRDRRSLLPTARADASRTSIESARDGRRVEVASMPAPSLPLGANATEGGAACRQRCASIGELALGIGASALERDQPSDCPFGDSIGRKEAGRGDRTYAGFTTRWARDWGSRGIREHRVSRLAFDTRHAEKRLTAAL